jgi:undecaprenyl-diphosphatase
MIAIERYLKARDPRQPVDTLAAVDAKNGLKIGLFQCFALIPGTSRSMCTILGGRLIGLSTHTAAEFSFLLAIPILGAATALDLFKERHALFGSSQAIAALAVGFGVSFVVALVVIRGFLKLLDRVGLEMFGVYRIVLGIVVLVVLRPH